MRKDVTDGFPVGPVIRPDPRRTASLRLVDDAASASHGLADVITGRLSGLAERWEAAASQRLAEMTEEQHRAAAAAIDRFAPACIDHLRTGSEDALTGAAHWLARAGLFRLFAPGQIQELLGCFHQAAWPLAALYAEGEVGRLVAAAEEITECALAAARVAGAEYQRRIVDQANDTAEFGFTLAEVTRSVTSTLNLDEVLQVVCREGARLMEAETVLVRILDERRQLVCRAAWGEHAADALGTTLPLECPDALCGRAVEARRVQAAVAQPDVALDSDRLRLHAGQTCLAAPIVAKGEALGAMLFVDGWHEAPADAAASAARALTAELLVAQVALTIYNARLHAQVQDLAYALDHIGECVFVTDTDGRVSYANRAALRTLGYEPTALVGSMLSDLYVDAGGETVPCPLTGAAEGEALWRHRDGSRVPFALVSAPIHGATGGQPRAVVLARDITEQKRREEQEDAHRAALQAKNRELEAFVYTVSHDLRAPLVSLHGLLGLVCTEYGEALDDAGRHLLQRLDVNVIRMERLIDDLLQFSRVGRHAEEADIDAAVVVAEILEDWQTRLAARGVSVTVASPLPPVHADRTSLRQVLENLLGNAAKFMGDRREPRIEIGGDTRCGKAHLYVRDNGIGIAPEHHEKVFEIFQRVHDLPDAGGTGVGLAIVKKAVEGWAGRVWIESGAGRGCTVHIEVPAGRSKREHERRGAHGADRG